MNAKSLCTTALLVAALGAQCQSSLYMPAEFRHAYAAGTRMFDGTVSAQYWQDSSQYDLKATIDPYKKLLTGEAHIVYFNNSPDTLHVIVFQSYPDYYRSDSRHQGFFGAGIPNSLISDGMVITLLKVNKKVISITDNTRVYHNGTNYIVRLADPLMPGTSLTMEVNWHYTIPGKGFERSGAIDTTSMFIGYWYPEMAVYDDIDGWDEVVYDASTEFYHDYSTYHVEVVAPDNFMVWACVPPDNPTDVYAKKIIDRIAAARAGTDPYTILSEGDFSKRSKGMLHWKYTAHQFPDFCFALSDHFLWTGCTYHDEKGDYFMQSAYPKKHPEFAGVLPAELQALAIFHTTYPSYAFPYHYFTVFNGLDGGGMEFPGMANDVEISARRRASLIGKTLDDVTVNLGLTTHEMCHMYFPFLMGINEKKYAWMDEGFAEFTNFFVPQVFPTHQDEDKPEMGAQDVVPMMVPTYQVLNSEINSYDIASYGYYALMQLLGKDTFTKCLNYYMDTWRHRHPTPYDLMFCFNTASGQDLSWFWKAWYFDWGYIDLGITGYNDGTLTVSNIGGRPIACDAVVTYKDHSVKRIEINPVVWKDQSTCAVPVPDASKGIVSVYLDIPTEGDVNAGNNLWKP